MSSSGPLVGRVLDGKYEIVRLLGRGGMGEVYAGTHIQLERPVAVKVLHGDLVADESFAARFAREARTAAKLEHPNAVHVYDFGALEGGSAYLVMEYIEGVTLREVMRRNPRMPIETILDLVRQAAGAVGAAHARGIMHRDIKPENMMVRAGDDGRPVLKVVDFGLAKLLENQTSQLTKGSELIGTPRYMAPEQFSGGRIDERVDIYALGCVLYELLAGRTPFEGTFMEVAGQHVFAEVPTLASFGVAAPDGVEDVARRALEKDPTKRTQSAAELVRELEAACARVPEPEEREAITIPLPAYAPVTAAGMSEIGTLRDADAFATRAETPAPLDELQTRRSEGLDEGPTLARATDEPPTRALGALAVDPNTRVARKARPTVVDLEPPVRPGRRPWAAIAAVACAGVVAFSAAAYMVSSKAPATANPAPTATTPAPATEATVSPAPPPATSIPARPEAPPEPAKPTEQPKRAATPRKSGSTTVAPDEDAEDAEDIPDMDEIPSAKSLRRLQRLGEQIQAEQERKARARERRHAKAAERAP